MQRYAERYRGVRMFSLQYTQLCRTGTNYVALHSQTLTTQVYTARPLTAQVYTGIDLHYDVYSAMRYYGCLCRAVQATQVLLMPEPHCLVM